MKRVLRSCFEPLPRFMSTKSLVSLVIMLLAGTGISVYEYLESARPLERHPERTDSGANATSEVHAAEPGFAGRVNPPPPFCEVVPAPSSSRAAEVPRCEVGPAARSAPDAHPCSPSVWEPSDQRIGN